MKKKKVTKRIPRKKFARANKLKSKLNKRRTDVPLKANNKESVSTKVGFTEKEKEDLLEAVRKQLNNTVQSMGFNVYKVNLDFLKLGRAEFIQYINNALSSLTDNAAYPTPMPALSIINNMISLESIARSDKTYEQANIYLSDIKDLMRQLCIYIANTCGNNVIKLRSAGVQENKKPGGKRKKAGKAEIIDVKDTNYSGCPKVKVKTMKGMQGLLGRWMLKDVEGATWQPATFSLGKSIIFTDLPIGATVWLQVRFKSSMGYGDWSQSKKWVVR
jgi:hypothetical protein